MQNLELANLKYVTYAQPILLPLKFLKRQNFLITLLTFLSTDYFCLDKTKEKKTHKKQNKTKNKTR